MKLLESLKFKIPRVYFITEREEIKEIPVGVPFIYGDENIREDMIRLLEYEVLYQEAMQSGFPFNFRKILRDNGYTDLVDYEYSHPIYMELTTEGLITEEEDLKDVELKDLKKGSGAFKKYCKDSIAYVDLEKLKNLKVFPVWLETIEDAVHTNIHNFAVFNNNMYNKKLEGMFGSLDLVSPERNLLVVDISGSIPKGVSSTLLALSKNLAETFYADLLITGSKSTLYQYENLYDLDINKIYEENGMDNDQTYFKRLVEREERRYKTAIVFGDNHSPGQEWSNKYNKKTKTISRSDGKKLCKWKIDKLISFHTNNTKHIAGYGEWFEPKEVEKIGDWVKYLN